MSLVVILYLVNFIRTLFIIFIIYYLIRIVFRYILPLLVQKGVNNMQQKMQNQGQGQQSNKRREGEVTIEKNRQQDKNNGSYKGEYVDFEEVD